MSNRRVVITGIGAVTPLGNNLADSWAGVTAGKSGIGSISHFDATGYPSSVAGEANFNPEDFIDKKEMKRYDRFIAMAIVAGKEAWDDAGIIEGNYDAPKMGSIVGVGIGGLPVLENNLRALIESGPRKVSPFLIPAMISNLAPGNLGIKHGLEGVNFTITSACTSGTHAIGEAARMIKLGIQDVVVCGGAEAAVTPLAVAGFGRMKALTGRNDEPLKASRPFDKDRDGFVIGEGAAILILEEYESAKKRGAKIYAEVGGYGFSCDAHHITAPKEGGEGAVACMSMALADSGLAKESINYINAHGTSTPVNDPAETAAVKTVFGDHAKNGLCMSSTKSMTGHLLGAAGGVEGAFLAKTIETGIVPPTVNLDEPDERCDLDYVPNEARELSVDAAMSNSFGFGGTNASILLKRV